VKSKKPDWCPNCQAWTIKPNGKCYKCNTRFSNSAYEEIRPAKEKKFSLVLPMVREVIPDHFSKDKRGHNFEIKKRTETNK
jgi:hypothetical protein